jgi:hypothetical protein
VFARAHESVRYALQHRRACGRRVGRGRSQKKSPAKAGLKRREARRRQPHLRRPRQAKDRKIVVVEEEAERVRIIFRRYLELGSLNPTLAPPPYQSHRSADARSSSAWARTGRLTAGPAPALGLRRSVTAACSSRRGTRLGTIDCHAGATRDARVAAIKVNHPRNGLLHRDLT